MRTNPRSENSYFLRLLKMAQDRAHLVSQQPLPSPYPRSLKNYWPPLTDSLLNLLMGTSFIPGLQVMKILSNAKRRFIRRGNSHSILSLVLLTFLSLFNSSLALRGKLHFNCNHIIIFMSSTRDEFLSSFTSLVLHLRL